MRSRVARMLVVASACGLVTLAPGADLALAADGIRFADFDGDHNSDLAIGVLGESINGRDDAGAVNVLYGTRSGLSANGDDFWHQDSPGIKGGAETGDRFGHAIAAGDFDNDNFDDLAIGVPFENVAGAVDAGGVNVLYGSADGLSSTDQFWSQDSAGVSGGAERSDGFGWALTVGNFDRDNFEDLAIGVPGETINGKKSAGAVAIMFGSATGLTHIGDQLWYQDVAEIEGSSENDDRFGESLAAGDFNGEPAAEDDTNNDDLAVGVPREGISDASDAGAVHMFYGTDDGPTAAGDDVLFADEVGEASETRDLFGSSLTAGFFNEGLESDLAVGVPGEDISDTTDAGAVHVLYGASPDGLSGTGRQIIHQGLTEIDGSADTEDFYGSVLASAQFSKDGFDDLAVGVPLEDVGNDKDSGGVSVIYGSADGLSLTSDQFWTQDRTGVEGNSEDDDAFGGSLSVGAFAGDKNGLAIGVPLETIGARFAAGAVNILYGSGSPLTGAGDQLFSQDSAGVKDASETEDFFGSA